MGEERITERKLTLRCRWAEYRHWLEQVRKLKPRWNGRCFTFCLMRPFHIINPGIGGALRSGADVEIIPEQAGDYLDLTVKMIEFPTDGHFNSEEAATRLNDLITESLWEFGGWEGDKAAEKQATGRKLGLHGSTLDRVREARSLIEQGIPKTQACRRAGIDPRTYDRYADQVINWQEDAEDWEDDDED